MQAHRHIQYFGSLQQWLVHLLRASLRTIPFPVVPDPNTCFQYAFRYINPVGLEVKAELYRHRTESDAFGVYSQERDRKYHFITAGVQGYLQQGTLNFLDGIYYIKLSTYQGGDTAAKAMQWIASALDEHLKQSNAWPLPLHLFPPEGKLLYSEQYIARNFLGYRFMNSAYIATYQDSTSWKIFIITSESPIQAKDMLTAYLAVIPQEEVRMRDEGMYEIVDPRNGRITVIIWKNFLCGILGEVSTSKRKQLLDKIRHNIDSSRF